MDAGALLFLVLLVLMVALGLYYRVRRGRQSQASTGSEPIMLGDPIRVQEHEAPQGAPSTNVPPGAAIPPMPPEPSPPPAQRPTPPESESDDRLSGEAISIPPRRRPPALDDLLGPPDWAPEDTPRRAETTLPPPPAVPGNPSEPSSNEPPRVPTGADLLDDTLDIADEHGGGMERAPESESAPPEPARVSAYYPKEAAPDTWLPLLAYVFRLSAAGKVEADAAAALRERRADYRPVSGDASAPLAEGALITATPDLPGFQFNPPSAAIAFYEDWHALPFKLRAVSAPWEQAANGRITFSVEGVIVADLPISVFVTTQPSAASAAPASASADTYEAIFCSYSHKDTAIVERVERAYKALGMDYLRDVVTLRSGEEWNARLLALIDQADIFQLFWSSASAESRYVQQEWEYALTLGRAGAFIRPVYWEQPMPKAPPPLGHLHFHFDSALAETR